MKQNNRMMERCVGWLAALVVFTTVVGAQQMPTINLSTNNCIVGFAMPATWGTIKGELKELTGWARFARPGDLNSLRGTVEVDVTALTTGSGGRDYKWREECLERGRFPKITFTLERITVTENQSFLLSGLLTIRDVTRPLVIGGQFSVEAERYHLTGGGEMKWTDYGVRDSSTFLTKVQPDMKVLLELWLPLK
ncbi:MAG: YceI family protein [Verrucomicrobiia bacterium]